MSQSRSVTLAILSHGSLVNPRLALTLKFRKRPLPKTMAPKVDKTTKAGGQDIRMFLVGMQARNRTQAAALGTGV